MINRGKGDNGYTDIVGPGRIPKYDPRAVALGSIDEATSAIGLARALSGDKTKEILKMIQSDLQILMGEIASLEETKNLIKREKIENIENYIRKLESKIGTISSFVLPGENVPSAALHLARTIVRKAERNVASLLQLGYIKRDEPLIYLNRLSDLLYFLSIFEEIQE